MGWAQGFSNEALALTARLERLARRYPNLFPELPRSVREIAEKYKKPLTGLPKEKLRRFIDLLEAASASGDIEAVRGVIEELEKSRRALLNPALRGSRRGSGREGPAGPESPLGAPDD